MLRTLNIRNYVLIDSLEISFPEGLIIITGQTGAGKSIILGALSLLMGSKADASVISGDADSCVVEAEFDVEDSGGIAAMLEENEVDWDGGHLIIRRVVNKSGRSRSFINDSPVNVQVLSGIVSNLIDIHSQHQSLLLTDRRFQLSALDGYARNGDLLLECRREYQELGRLEAEHAEVSAKLASVLAEKDYNEALFNRLDAAALRDGELEELEQEQKQLANAEEIKESLCSAEGILNPEGDDMPSVDSMLREAEHLLGRISKLVPELSAVHERLESSRIELDDILSEISSVNSRIEVSQERLVQVEDRMSLLYDLMKKHSCRTVSELIEVRERLSDALFDSSALETRKHSLEKSIAESEERLAAIASKLHQSREEASRSFAESITGSLRFLELDRAVFAVALSESPISATGSDTATFLFSADGRDPVDVAKCASGGEISRIMLCLKAMMSKFTAMPTMIFDEIDTGVSGSVADKMGSMICSMGDDMQVFAITHLPQVAAKGDAHYLVSKSAGEDGRVVSTITQLDYDRRVMEIARMLSGSSVSDAAISNAKNLLDS